VARVSVDESCRKRKKGKEVDGLFFFFFLPTEAERSKRERSVKLSKRKGKERQPGAVQKVHEEPFARSGKRGAEKKGDDALMKTLFVSGEGKKSTSRSWTRPPCSTRAPKEGRRRNRCISRWEEKKKKTLRNAWPRGCWRKRRLEKRGEKEAEPPGSRVVTDYCKGRGKGERDTVRQGCNPSLRQKKKKGSKDGYLFPPRGGG